MPSNFEAAGSIARSDTAELIVSGYTEEGYGAGPGLARFSLQPDGSVGECLVEGALLKNPSFVAAGQGVLIAVEELPEGNVVALDPHSFEVLGRAPSGGADTCHVAVVGDAAWAANYSSGTAVVVPLPSLLAGEGPKDPELVSHPGSGPVADRQGESHAHQVTATPWGTVLVSDLGADRVDEYSASSRVRLGSAELPPGTGPRHVALKGDFLLVSGELDGHLHVLRRSVDEGTSEVAADGAARVMAGSHSWHWLFRVPLAASAEKVTAVPEFYPSHIELSTDGNTLYAAVRGANTLVALDVSGLDAVAATPGAPRFLREVPCGGNWPRHFAVANVGSGSGSGSGGGGRIYVANQLSNSIAVFSLDDQGLPDAEPMQLVEFGSPACILLAG